MNLILFEPDEINQPLPRGDRRALHILNVLRRGPGEVFDAGLINGPRGKGTVVAIEAESLRLAFAWGPSPTPAAPEGWIRAGPGSTHVTSDRITLIVGLPRPQTARDILRDATTLGVRAIHFVLTEKSEPSYGASKLWSSDEWRRQVWAGAEQAFATDIPVITCGRPLAAALDEMPAEAARLALDNYESAAGLGEYKAVPGTNHVLALGGERGWSAGERATLRERDFTFVHLGARVLRTETATVAALAILRAKLGLM